MQKLLVSPVKVDNQPASADKPKCSEWYLTEYDDLVDVYRILRNIDKYTATDFAEQVRAAVSSPDAGTIRAPWKFYGLS